MAFRKISELSSSLTPSGSGIIPIVINGTTFGTTLDAIKDQINSVLTPQYASSSITSSVDTLIGNVSSLNTFTSSADSRLDSMEIFTGSLNDYYATDQELLELREYFNTYSSSNNTVNTQQNIRLDALDGLEIATGSLLTQIETEKGRIDAILLSSDADKDSFKEIVDLINSVDTENDNAFGTYVLNTNDRLDSIEVESGSIRSEFNSYTSSANQELTEHRNVLEDHELQRWLHGERLTSIETFTGSLSDTVNDITTIEGRLDKLEIESGSIRDEFNSFTSSYLIVSQSFNDRISTLEGYHIPEPTATPNATPQPTPSSTPNATPQPTPNATPQQTPEPDPPTSTPNATPNPTPIAPVNFTIRFQLDGGNSTYTLKDLSIPQSFGNTHDHTITGYNHDGYETVTTNVVANSGYSFIGNNFELTYAINGSPITTPQWASQIFMATYNSATDSWDLLIRVGSVGNQHLGYHFADLITEGEVVVVTIAGNATLDSVPTSTPNATPNPTPTSTVAPPSPTSTPESTPSSTFNLSLERILKVATYFESNSLDGNVGGRFETNNQTVTFNEMTQWMCDNDGHLTGVLANQGNEQYPHIFIENGNTVEVGSTIYRDSSGTLFTDEGFCLYMTPGPLTAASGHTWVSVDALSQVTSVSQFSCTSPTPTPTETVAPPSPTSTPEPDPTPYPTATPNATPNPTPTSTPINYYLRTNYSSNMGSTRMYTDPNSPVTSFGESYGTTEGASLSTMVYLHLGLGSDNLDYTVTVNGNPYNNGDTIDGVDGPITITPTWDGIPGSSNRIFGIYSYVLNPINKVYNIDVTVVPLPTSTPVPTSTPNATPNPTPLPDPTPTSTVAPPSPTSTSTPETDYTQFDYFLTWRRNPVANGMTYDFTRLDGNTNDYFYSNEQIKCVYETFGNGGGNFWNIAVGDNSEGLISVGDNSWNNVSLSDINVISPFSNTTRAVWNDANDRMGNGPQHYIITFVSGEVTELVSFDSIGDVSGCTPYTDPAPTSTPNATPNPTATVAPPSPTSTVAPISCISSAPLNINVESEYDSNSNTTTFKYITSDLDGNGGLFGCINVDRGSTVTINVTGSAPNLETHPIKITNFNGLDQHEASLPNVVSTWNAGSPYSLTWEVPCDVGITQYQYQCENHSNMRGVINVSGACPTPTPSPTSTPNATPNPTPTETPNSTPEPEPTLCLTSVNSIQTNDGKYKFNGSAYGPYGVNVGTYVIENVPGAHPIAFLNNGKESLITYSGEIANGSKDGLDGNNYTFYSGDVTVNVIGDFDTLSYECYYHGYMGGENNLVFDGTLCNPIPTATPNPTPSNNTIYVHTP